MWDTCPNCGGKPVIHQSAWASIIESGEGGDRSVMCLVCRHQWQRTPEEQKFVIAEAQRRLAKTAI